MRILYRLGFTNLRILAFCSISAVGGIASGTVLDPDDIALSSIRRCEFKRQVDNGDWREQEMTSLSYHAFSPEVQTLSMLVTVNEIPYAIALSQARHSGIPLRTGSRAFSFPTEEAARNEDYSLAKWVDGEALSAGTLYGKIDLQSILLSRGGEIPFEIQCN